METTSPEPEPDDPFGLVERFDSIEDPYLRSEFLDAVGTTRSYINALRLRRDQAVRKASAPVEPDHQEATAEPKPPRVDEKGPQRRAPRPPVRTRVLATRPPRYAGSVRSKRRRNRRRPEIVVIIFKLD